MEYVGRTPSPPLDAFVERIWYCSDATLGARERVIPGGGTIDLVVNLAEDEIRTYEPEDAGRARVHSGTLVLGTSTRSFFADSGQRACAVGAHFRPGGAFPFLGISPAEIVDGRVPLADVWGCAGRELREQLLEARSAEARLALVEAALFARLRRARASHPAVREAVTRLHGGGNGARVAEVATAVGLSHRRFVEVFEREVGLTPKFHARLQRFHRVKQRIATLEAPPSWAAFALECGYFDQSHMIRDFVEFSAVSPEAYLRSREGEARWDHLVHNYSEREDARRMNHPATPRA